jgi:hypothetical protein
MADLAGPVHGVVEMPLRLFWSAPDRTFDLDQPSMLRALYETVLREASRPDDLSSYLNGETLVAVWPELFLPKGVRRAWEDQHPELRAAGRYGRAGRGVRGRGRAVGRVDHHRPGVAQLIGLAVTLDPGLTADDFAEAGQRLDRLGDKRFARCGLAPADVTRLRERFALWPRTPRGEHDRSFGVN